MTLESEEFDNMMKMTIAVSMTDGAKFRGNLDAVGDKVIVLKNVVEMADHGKWVKPMVSTASFADVIGADNSTISMDERAYLDKVVIYKEHILRLWPWDPKKLSENIK